MDWKVMATVFASVFLAELGDKTQLAVFCFSAAQKSKLAIFLGASLALILTSLLAVILGCTISHFVKEVGLIHRLAGVVFIVIGLFMVFGKLSKLFEG
jgi:putative Ca2+/H+ antiporter (TMEM165/GDT1 family)